MKVYIAADHAGFELKKELIPYVEELGFEVEDCGASQYTEDDDYPDFISKAAEAVSLAPTDRAIVIGGSGQGEAMVANKYRHVRAAVYNGKTAGINLDEIRLSREHNDANVLSLGARFLTVDDAKMAVREWLTTNFSGEERHVRRIKKIDDIEATW